MNKRQTRIAMSIGLLITCSAAFLLCMFYKDTYYCNNTYPLKSMRRYLVDSNGKQSVALRHVLELTEVDAGSFKELVAQTQQAWIRPANKERWEIEQKPYEHLQEQFKPLFTELGMVEPINPSLKLYDYALVFGALGPSVLKRMKTLIRLWDSGVRFKQIVLLAGARQVQNQFESPEVIAQLVGVVSIDAPLRTETEIMRYLWSALSLPPELKAVPVIVIDTPMQALSDGSMRRPNTADTILLWMHHYQPKGTCCALSSQPYVGYQDAVLQRLLPASVEAETVGDAVDMSKTNSAIMLDTLARWLFETEKSMTNKQKELK